jgi:hypothetical protein
MGPEIEYWLANAVVLMLFVNELTHPVIQGTVHFTTVCVAHQSTAPL